MDEVFIVFGSIVAIVTVVVFGSIIKTWINKRGGNNLANNEEFLEALRQFKQKTDRRLSHLEAIVVDELPEKKTEKINPPADSGTIEVDRDESGSQKEQDKGQSKGSDGNIRNMLNE